MKNLEELVSRCMKDLDSIGICYRPVRSWQINNRAKSRWGQCVSRAPGVFDISIAGVLLEESVSDQAVLNTIAHELLHTIAGCEGHRGAWKRLAEQVNESLPGYHITRCTTPEEKGVTMPERRVLERYVLQCTSCGAMIRRQKLCPVVKSPHRYRCAACGGKIKRVK